MNEQAQREEQTTRAVGVYIDVEHLLNNSITEVVSMLKVLKRRGWTHVQYDVDNPKRCYLLQQRSDDNR